MATVLKRKEVVSWAMYDWANSAFATTVMAGFFPVFFKQYWSAGNSATESTFHLGIANSAASLVIVLMAPVLGAIADRGGAKKPLLLIFAALGIVMTALLYGVDRGEWSTAAWFYALASVGFSGSLIFYDALIVDVSPRQNYESVSALGFSLGYLGGGLLFALNVLMTLHPQWFGLADSAEAVRLSFVTVALWWAMFSVPLVLKVAERRQVQGGAMTAAIAGGMRQLVATFSQVRRYRTIALFLLGYWLYIDGVHTVIRMAVDYGMSLGFDPNSLIVALLVTQFVGFPAALGFGWLGERYGPRLGISLAIAVYLGVVVWASVMDSAAEFYAIAVVVGLVQGGIQSLSRSFYARIIPADKAGEFFGFYNMVGKFAAVIGPVMMGWVGVVTSSSRLSILSVALLFLLGGWLFRRVDLEEAEELARQSQ